jgi:hypothetical protein
MHTTTLGPRGNASITCDIFCHLKIHPLQKQRVVRGQTGSMMGGGAAMEESLHNARQVQAQMIRGRAIRFIRQMINQSNRHRMTRNHRWLPPSVIQHWFLTSAQWQSSLLTAYVPCGRQLAQARTCSLTTDYVQPWGTLFRQRGKTSKP